MSGSEKVQFPAPLISPIDAGNGCFHRLPFRLIREPAGKTGVICTRGLYRAITRAGRRAGLSKRPPAHSFRRSFAMYLLVARYAIRIVQELLGHSSVETTMIYVHVLSKGSQVFVARWTATETGEAQRVIRMFFCAPEELEIHDQGVQDAPNASVRRF